MSVINSSLWNSFLQAALAPNAMGIIPLSQQRRGAALRALFTCERGSPGYVLGVTSVAPRLPLPLLLPPCLSFLRQDREETDFGTSEW